MVYVPQKFDGNSEGATAVAAGGDGGEIGSDGCCCAAAGASGGAGRCPRGFCR